MTQSDVLSQGWVREFRDRRGAYRFHSYECLHSADHWHIGRQAVAREVLAGKWQWKGKRSVSILPPLDWDGLCADSRSWNLALHSWDPLASLLTAFDRTGESGYVDLAIALASDWLEQYRVINGPRESFAWYDLAVGLRAYRLAYLLDVVARDGDREDALISSLLAGLLLHAEALADDERFADHSNHGFYQVLAQLAYARRFPDVTEIARGGAQGRSRLTALLEAHFTEEGVHREHSPHYQGLVLIPIRALQDARLIEDPEISVLCRRIEDALAWFVTPAGRYAMFGDTSRQAVITPRPKRIGSPMLRFAMSSGCFGEPPATNSRAFPDSGYVVFRDRWPVGTEDFSKCSYLAQTCAFHSRVHKHADDLSFVWYDQECDLLTDAGRFGYVGRTDPTSTLFAEGFWYSDPRRVYVESTCAHNTVEVDGKSIQRRKVRPYGSALTNWGEADGVRFSRGHVDYAAYSHTRVLLFSPRSWLLVLDYLGSNDRQPHEVVQRFHLAPELDLEEIDGGLVTRLPSGGRLHATPLIPCSPVSPARGADRPRLLGWISPSDGLLEPQWTFGWRADKAFSHRFATLFSFGIEAPRVTPMESRSGNEASPVRFGWMIDGTRHAVAFAHRAEQQCELSYDTE